MKHKFPALDGWRGISIVLVLCTHLLPLGPHELRLNTAAGVAGMAIFFVLSGFLITRLLISDGRTGSFLTRRLLRIVPLYAVYVLTALWIIDASPAIWWRTLSFTANLPPQALVPVTAHLWSLCLEFQFYLLIALGFRLFGARVLIALPLLAIGVTALRMASGVYASSISYFRADEIIAGCMLALIHDSAALQRVRHALSVVPSPVLLVFFALSCHEVSGPLNFARPYLAAAMVGATLFQPQARLAQALSGPVLAYIASISYALYILHPGLAATWLGSGDLVEKYAKRPLLFVTLWAMAHLSTRYFEKYFIDLGHRLTRRTSVVSPSEGSKA